MAASQLTPAAPPRSPLSLPGVSVLIYHGLAEPAPGVPLRERKYWLSRGTFASHLAELRASGYRTSLLEELWGGGAEQPRQVVFTFDDGRASDYRVAFPLLSQAGARAHFFVNTATVGQPGYLGWNEIAELRRAGMSIQSHGHDHVYLSRLSARQLEWQLERSKALLEDRLGRAVEFLAAPYGALNRQVLAAAERAGYRAVCNSVNWPARPRARMVNRVAVYADTRPREFRRLLVRNPLPFLKRKLRTAALYLPKRVVLGLRPHRLGVQALKGDA